MKALPHRILTKSIALLALAPALAMAQTLDTFDGGGTPATATQLGGAPGPLIQAGGPDGNFLRLTTAGANGTDNHYTYDLSAPGAFETITAQFDFRILSPGADGFSLSLIPTSVFGNTGNGPGYTAEEPDFGGMFGMAFDLYDNINNVSAHWNGLQINELYVSQTPGIGVDFRNNAVFNHAFAQIQRVGNGSNLTVTLTPNSLGAPGAPYKVFEIALPNMLPFENRVQLAGRTGGVNQTVDLDNVNVAYTNPFLGGLAAAPTGRLFQNFDSTGSSNYRVIQQNQRDDGTFRPGPLLKPADAGSNGAFLRLANDGVNSNANRVAFDRAFDGGTSNTREMLEFDMRFSSGDQPADGLGILFLPTSAHGFAGEGIASDEEPNHPGILGVGIDMYPNGTNPNGSPDVFPGVSLHWNNVEIADVALDPSIALGQFHRLQVIRESAPGGLNVSINAIPNINGAPGTPVSILNNVFVAGARNYDYRLEFAARTGGADANHDIDTISTSQIALAPKPTTQSNFNSGEGASWKAFHYGAGTPARIQNDAGPNGDYLRLTHAENGQSNSLAFDQQADGTVGAATGIVADFDTRMISGGTPADGFSMMFIPSATYGATGFGAAGAPGFIAEEPNLAGVFGLAFDLFNGGPEFNEVSLHWNGGPIVTLDAGLNLDSGVFHHVRLELNKSGSDVLASLTLTPDIFGTPGVPINVFTNTVIPGMGFYDYRVEFAGRTGGLNMSVDLDNISVATVPEPGSAALLALGLGTLLRRRRK